MEFNSEGMFRASRVAGGAPVVEIYRSAAAAAAAADHSPR
jgi:hypothetical protein